MLGGMKHRAIETSSLNPTNFLGILYAEDFDEPHDAQQKADPKPSEPERPPLTQADIDAACVAAVEQARLEWAGEEERNRAATLGAIGTTLASIRDTCEHTTLVCAEGTVTTILALVAGLLPEFCRQHGPTEARALLARLLPIIQSQSKITVRVHPDVVALVQRDVGELDPDLASMVVVTAGPMDRADVRVAWENGSMTRDTQQIMQAIQDALGQLGLHQKIEAPMKRTMAYAD